MNNSEFALNLAIVIGINDYQNNISALATARQDAEAIAHLLKTSYQYQVILITDETEIQPTFERLQQFFNQDLPKYIQSPDSTRLLLYFAGHGIAEASDRGPAGYLIPQNAKLGDVSTYLSMHAVHDALCRLSCHHLLVILDCCFGGAFRWANSRDLVFLDSNRVYKQHYEYFIRFPAWQVITSAAHDQTALDLSIDRRRGEDTQHSPFAAALIEGLQQNQADLIRDRVITVHELYVYLQDRLTRLLGTQQTPGMWALKPDYDRGEFIFTPLDFDQDALADAPPIDSRSNPYRGLKPFEERHAELFFGREVLVRQLVDRLSATAQHQASCITQKLLIILGVSGSGKSSLVKAGLLPKLRSQANQTWHILAPMRPGRSPFTSLARILLPIVHEQFLQQLKNFQFLDQQFTTLLKNQPSQQANLDSLTLADRWLKETSELKLLLILNHVHEFHSICSTPEFEQLSTFRRAMVHEIGEIRRTLQQDPQNLAKIVQAWWEKHPTAKLLIVIDQLEELVTMMPTAQTAASRVNSQNQINTIRQSEWWKFLETLQTSLENAPNALHLILTLRSDFEPRFYKTPLQDYWKDASFYIEDMTSDELRSAIEKPALKQAIYFEPPVLVSRLVDDVRKMPGALPLLSFTLSELHRTLQERWRLEKSTDRALRETDYEALGGVAKSLANRATQEYEELAQGKNQAEGERLQSLMRRVIGRMISLEGGGTRRRVLKSELIYPNEQDSQDTAEILDRLVERRLIVAGQDFNETYYEPAHDSLVVHWTQEWLTPQAKEEIALQRLLSPAAREWQQRESQWKEQHRSRSLLKNYTVGKAWQAINQWWDQWELYETARLQAQQQRHDSSSPNRFLWNRNPRLPLVKRILFSRFNNWLNNHEAQFVRKSVLEKRKSICSVVGAFTVLISLAGLAIVGQRNALIQEIEVFRMASEQNWLIHQDLDALVNSIRATKPLNSILLKIFPPDQASQTQLQRTTQNILYRIKELNQWHESQYEVFTAKFTLDGNYLIAGGYDQTLQLLRMGGNRFQLVKNYEEHRTKLDKTYVISSSAFSRDGKKLATADFGGVIHIWNYKSGVLNHQALFSINDKAIRSLAISPTNSNLLASAGADGVVRFWDISRKQHLSSIPNAHQGKRVEDVDFSNDGKLLATAGRDGIVYIYQVEKLLENNSAHFSKPLAKCQKKDGERIVYNVQFNPTNPNQLLTADSGGAYLWNLELDNAKSKAISCSKKLDFKNNTSDDSKASNSAVRSASFSPRGNLIATAGDDGTVFVWDLTKDKQLSEMRGHDGAVYDVNFSPDGDRIVTAGKDGTVRLWNWNQTSVDMKDVDIRTSVSRKVAFSSPQSTRRYLAIARQKGGFQVWKLDQASNSYKKVCEKDYHKTKYTGLTFSLAFSPDGEFLAVGGEHGTVSLWNLKDQCTQWAIQPTIDKNVNAIQFNPKNGNLLAAALGDGSIWLWNIENLSRTKINQALPEPLIFRGHQKQTVNLSFSPNGESLVTVGNDRAVRIWNTKQLQDKLPHQSAKVISDRKVIQLPFRKECRNQHQEWVEGVSFHPDGNLFATSDSGSTILLWNIQTILQKGCEPLKTRFKRYGGDVYGLSFSSDGTLLAAGYQDGTVRLWSLAGDLELEAPSSKVFGANQQIYSVAFNPEAQVLAIAGKSNTVRLWTIPKFDNLLAQSCDRVKAFLETNADTKLKDVRKICKIKDSQQ